MCWKGKFLKKGRSRSCSPLGWCASLAAFSSAMGTFLLLGRNPGLQRFALVRSGFLVFFSAAPVFKVTGTSCKRAGPAAYRPLGACGGGAYFSFSGCAGF